MRLVLAIVLSVLLLPLARAFPSPPPTTPQGQGLQLFETRIRPVLVEHCYACHSAPAQKNKKLRGGLLVDTREGLLTGGDSGPALVPGKPAGSLVLTALRWEKLQMPPRHRLPDRVVADFETWIRLGAPDPRVSQPAPAAQKGMSIEEGRRFWAYKPPRMPAIPAVKDPSWVRGDIDAFILARIEAQNLRPTPDADRPTLLRRLYFDLTGLPPTPEQVDAFVRDAAPDAYERQVDRLLASPEYGERWGRHWLDVARYGESLTLRGFLFKEAWRYRDYVIDSFNQDLPFDRFIQEQIAGDLLPADSWRQRRRQLIATSFLTLGNTNLEEQDKRQLRMDVVDEQLDVICRAFLAQTVTCARCHDHKFDPIPTRDYYALAGILRSTRTLEHANVSQWLEFPLPAAPEQEDLLRRQEAAVSVLRKEIAVLKAAVAKSAAPLPVDKLSPVEKPVPARDLPANRDALLLRKKEDELKALLAGGPRRDMVMSVAEEKQIEDARIHIRGSVQNQGERAPRGFLQVATLGQAVSLPANESGRRELAAWLAGSDNPLPARVMANRVWHWLFGAGLVRTPDNFGTTGSRPSHPELLDYLAVRFIEDGWSIKKLVRLVVTSHTYRQSTAAGAALRQADPENRLFACASRRRLDAECLRDAMLVVSGQLRLDRGGPTFPPDLTTDYGYRDAGARRSVYIPVFRNALPDIFEVFDFADPSVPTGQRNHSTVAPQALFLMNHPFVLDQSRQAARRLLALEGLDEVGRLTRAYRLALSRPPTEAEIRLARKFLARPSATPQDQENAWAQLVQVLFASLDFRFVN
jgi:Protein of unknown function (DUF1553)/Protein of unknown function (DUF1549)/Planctomycete cytochrome C